MLLEYDSSNNWQASYVYGNFIHEPLYMANNEDGYYYVQNHLYSTVAVVDSSGNITERYEYDVYGKPHILDADYSDDADGISDCNNPYMFTGRRVDWLDEGNLKIQLNRHRYYSYDMGRWYTEDPLGVVPNGYEGNQFRVIRQYVDGLNLYEYVKNTPITEHDSRGLMSHRVGPVCCKIKETRSMRIRDPHGIDMRLNRKTCTQKTIYSECPPEAACCAAYKDNKNVEVYSAESRKCCSCKVYISHSWHRSYPHAKLVVICDDGGRSFSAEVRPNEESGIIGGIIGLKPSPVEKSYDISGLNPGTANQRLCDISCKQARNIKLPHFWTWTYINNCYVFAYTHGVKACSGCP